MLRKPESWFLTWSSALAIANDREDLRSAQLTALATWKPEELEEIERRGLERPEIKMTEAERRKALTRAEEILQMDRAGKMREISIEK